MVSTDDLDQNLKAAADLIASAAATGTQIVVLPENFAVLSADAQVKVKLAEPAGDGPIQQFLSEQAREHGIVLIGGTIPILANEPGKVRAACLTVGPDGELLGRYDKIHLFDVALNSGKEQYNESATIEHGENSCVIDTPWGKLGVAVCYDIRFPELFRQMTVAGAQIVALPSAFTATTGLAHWEILLRARAIENQCYLIAPDQGAGRERGRHTWGHSMIISPWGDILAELDEQGSGVATAEINLQSLEQLREKFPALQHCRTL
jgi:nitrilase